MNPKEMKKQLQNHFCHRIELHTHSKPMSNCSSAEPKELVAKYKELGYSAVTLANHFIYNAGETAEEYVDRFLRDFHEAESEGERLGIKVYLAAELRFTENVNDYLLFGVDKQMLIDIYNLLPEGIENFRKAYAMPDSVLVWAHPKRDRMTPIDPALVDGVESFNLHSGQFGRIGLTALMALEHDVKIITAGSDVHSTKGEGLGVSAIRVNKVPEDSFGLAKVLRDGDYVLEIGRNHIVLP